MEKTSLVKVNCKACGNPITIDLEEAPSEEINSTPTCSILCAHCKKWNKVIFSNKKVVDHQLLKKEW